MIAVLIDPPTSFEQVFGEWDLSELDTYCAPLGLLHLASFAREHGHAVHVIDVDTLRWSPRQTVEHVLSLEPDLVGFSAKTINILAADAIARALRAAGFDGPIVLGGAHVTALPVPALSRFDAFDGAVLGEGELTFLELLDAIQGGRSPRGLLGTAWRDAGGGVVVNAPRPPLEDLDILPFPAWDLLPDFPRAYPHSALESKRLPAASIITSRGCPYQCTFCDRAVFGSRLRQHSARYTLEMIRHLRDSYGIRDLMILDDNFILDRKKLFEVCDAMIAERMDLSWYCMGHAKVMSADRLRKIRSAGCWIIEVGVESGCDRILKTIRKNTTKAEIESAVQRARRAGLKVKGNFIFGFPTETRESLEETIDFATRIGLSYFQQNFLTVWPGCALAQDASRHGRLDDDWGRLAHQRITFVPAGLTEQDLTRASKQAFRRFYLRPRVVLEVLLQAVRSQRALRTALLGLRVFLRTISRAERAAPGASG